MVVFAWWVTIDGELFLVCDLARGQPAVWKGRDEDPVYTSFKNRKLGSSESLLLFKQIVYWLLVIGLR